MVDNVDITPGSGATFATDDIGGIQYPRVKVTQGADGAAVDVSSAAPLQVTLANGTVPSHAVTNAGTFAVQESGAALTALQLIGDTVTAQGTALGTTKTTLQGGSVTTSSPTYTTGQISPLSLDTSGALRVNVTAGGGAGGTSSTVGAAAPSTATAVGFTDGTNMQLGVIKPPSTAPVATDRAIVVAMSPNSQNANGQATMANSTPVVIASDQSAVAVTPAGNVAHAAADSGNPVKQGFKATTSLAGLTLVANANRTDAFSGVDGVQIMRPHCNLEDIVSGVLANTDGASTSVIAAQGAGVKTYITTAIFANTSATAVTVDLRDGAAGSVKATFPVPANTSGLVCNLPVPLPFSANTAVCMDGSAAATTVTCTLIGFKSKI